MTNDPNSWDAQGEFNSLEFASSGEAKRAAVLFNRLVQELERLSARSEAGPFIQGPMPDDVDWSKMRPGPIQFVPNDEPRMDWLQSHSASIYKSVDGTYWVVVDETARVRKGNIGKTLREAIDDAMGKQSLPQGERS